MNLRQTQRALADVITKSQAAHVQLPVDAFEGLLSAGEALRHSRVAGKFHVEDAVDELKQRYGLEPKYQQVEDAFPTTRKKRHRLRRGDEPPARATTQEDTEQHVRSESSSLFSASGSESEDHSKPPSPKKSRTGGAAVQRVPPKSPPGRHDHGTSRIDRIIQHHPAKNPLNEELAEEFVELGGYEFTHGEKQKALSRMAVAKQIREAEQPIGSGAQARALPRVGPSAAAKIDEVLHRGKMKALEQYEEEYAREHGDADGDDGDDGNRDAGMKMDRSADA